MNATKFFYDFGRAIYHVDAVYEDFANESEVTSWMDRSLTE